MAVIGIVPAAGSATRLQPLQGSKEMYSVGGRAAMDYVLERMRAAPCADIRVVTRPEKTDVVAHAEAQDATVVLGSPQSVAESFLLGARGADADDILLLGFPDTIWEPPDGFAQVVAALGEGADVALGLFTTAEPERCDVALLGEGGRVTRVLVKPLSPPSEVIWGCAALRARVGADLAPADELGTSFDRLSREGRVAGVFLSAEYTDIGTKEALARLSPGQR